jgi:dihydroorotate dehydrogenase (fumarate)
MRLGRHRGRTAVRAVVDTGQCVGCLVCAQACRYDAIDKIDGKAFVNASCAGCGACIEECPQNAISLVAMDTQA